MTPLTHAGLSGPFFSTAVCLCPFAEPAHEGGGVPGRGARVQGSSAAELGRAGGYPRLGILTVLGMSKGFASSVVACNQMW